MNKKTKLARYRRVRAIRDELLNCTNQGRQRRLLMELPNSSSVHLINRAEDRCTVELITGFEFTHYGNDCIIKCGIDVYMHWLKNYCN